jgi:toxin HigB-1
VIKSFKKETEAIHNGEDPGSFYSPILKVARRKLAMVHAAVSLQDLKSPPGNKLHDLKGDRKGQWAIRINDQYRICFYWTPEGATEVEITDYH